MKRLLNTSTLLLTVLLLLSAAIPAAAAPASSTSGMNAQFLQWQEKEHIIHIFVYDDAGRPGQPAAVVRQHPDILLGFEWEGAGLSDALYNNPDHDITLSIDGGAAFSVKDGYQEPFDVTIRSGPVWAWDHDGDGLGDRDGDGIDDWGSDETLGGEVMFFRYQVGGLSLGTHTLAFTMHHPGGSTESDLITVEVVKH